jgi:hypothetical protein
LVDRGLFDRAEDGAAGVVDQRVDPPGLLQDVGDGGVHRGVVRHVQGNELGAVQQRNGFGAASAGEHAIPARGEVLGGRLADAR